MTRLVHLSDLHFGRDRPELLRPLTEAVNDLAPDLLIVSGDLTQRARESQFRAARDFLDTIRAPVLCVPGNHDIPVHRPVTRLFRPFRPFRRWIHRDLAPVVRLDGVAVVGMNSVDPWRWQRGRIRGRDIRRACAIAEDAAEDTFVVLVAHHPLEHRPGTDKRLTRGAARAIDRLAACGADAILSGHLHVWLTGPFLTRPEGARILQVHAGTGLSTRHRGEPNDFACIDRDGDSLRIARWTAEPEGDAFAEASRRTFARGPDGWRSSDGGAPVPRSPAADAEDGAHA
ncbi:MAG: metallophosphoesterase family protein [Pseudooceanicola sp.]